jgi:hypothetical protein
MLAQWGCVMSLQGPRRRKSIEDVRCPNVKDLPNDIYHMLHHSFVEILKMRRSIESADAHIDKSIEAATDSWDVLKRAQDAGF